MDWNPFIAPILQALGTALAGLLVAIATQALRRVNVSLSKEQQAQLEHLAKLGAAYAEEKARQAIKERIPLQSETKQAIAMNYVREHLPTVETEKIAKTVTAVLPEVRQTTLAGAAADGVVVTSSSVSTVTDLHPKDR